MSSILINYLNSLKAEFLKTKRTPILWVSIIGALFITSFIFLLHYVEVEKLNEVGKSPWGRYFQFGFAMVSMLLLVPYVVLVNSAVVYTEHNALGWKYLYTLPLSKGNFYFAKLGMVLLLIVSTYVLFLLSILLGGYLLVLLKPEFGFQSFPPPVGSMMVDLMHSFISILGITGLHFWLSIRWKNFIPPVSIGLLAFILALTLVISQKYDLAIYFPYCYSTLVGNQYGLEEFAGLKQWGPLTDAEWYSLGFFIVFNVIGFWEERNKNVI